jgi:hypothetical protein
MAEVHQTIIRYGIGVARSQAVTKHKRMLVEAAYRVLAEDAEKIGFTYSGFACKGRIDCIPNGGAKLYQPAEA